MFLFSSFSGEPVKKVKCGQIPLLDSAGRKKRCAGCDDAAPGSWPWMARILYQGNFDDKQNTYCGGSLVSVRHVATSAHCVEETRFGNLVAVDLGEFDLRTEYDCLQTADECGGNGSEGQACFAEGRCAAKRERYKVTSSLAHPSFKKISGSGTERTPEFDVAVLVLEKPVQLTTFIQPICLPPPESEKESTSRFFVLQGWGNIQKGFQFRDSPAKILQELRGLEETPLDECRKLVDDVALLERDHMCVWKKDSDANGCYGDTGGPIAEQNEGSWDLAGVVSFGTRRTCSSITPLVATRMSAYAILSWVKEIVGEDLPSRLT